MYIIVTIDTEEDQWGNFSHREITCNNIRKIPKLQDIFNRFGVRPTYLINYPVATDRFAIKIFTQFQKMNLCEVGMHCHPWNTPPYLKNVKYSDTMLCNLPYEVQYEKLHCLYNVISKNFEFCPTSFRAGRWGFGSETARAISALNIFTDSSVTPHINWNIFHGPDFSSYYSLPYRFNYNNIKAKEINGSILEIPVTIGYLQSYYKLLQGLVDNIFPKMLHFRGLLSRSRLLNLVWLSPELTELRDMIKLTENLKKRSYPVINVAFHSTSLQYGLSPFVSNYEEENNFFSKIESFFDYCNKSNFVFITLTEYNNFF
jgi:hypothetical protein